MQMRANLENKGIVFEGAKKKELGLENQRAFHRWNTSHPDYFNCYLKWKWLIKGINDFEYSHQI